MTTNTSPITDLRRAMCPVPGHIRPMGGARSPLRVACTRTQPAPMDSSVAIDSLHSQWTILYRHCIGVL